MSSSPLFLGLHAEWTLYHTDWRVASVVEPVGNGLSGWELVTTRFVQHFLFLTDPWGRVPWEGDGGGDVP